MQESERLVNHQICEPFGTSFRIGIYCTNIARNSSNHSLGIL